MYYLISRKSLLNGFGASRSFDVDGLGVKYKGKEYKDICKANILLYKRFKWFKNEKRIIEIELVEGSKSKFLDCFTNDKNNIENIEILDKKITFEIKSNAVIHILNSSPVEKINIKMQNKKKKLKTIKTYGIDRFITSFLVFLIIPISVIIIEFVLVCLDFDNSMILDIAAVILLILVLLYIKLYLIGDNVYDRLRKKYKDIEEF